MASPRSTVRAEEVGVERRRRILPHPAADLAFWAHGQVVRYLGVSSCRVLHATISRGQGQLMLPRIATRKGAALEVNWLAGFDFEIKVVPVYPKRETSDRV